MFYIKLSLMCLWAFVATLLLFPFFWVPNAFSRWVWFVAIGVLKIAGIEAEMEGAENMGKSRPCVITGNHQSAFDFATFGKFIPDRCIGIAKRELVYMPLIGWYFYLSGGFLIDRKKRDEAVSVLSDAAKRLKDGKLAIGIMPEGTRNKAGKGLLPFKKGAFHMALEAEADIVVTVSEPLEHIANLATRTLKPGRVRIKTFPPLSTKGKTVDELMEIVRSTMLRQLDEFAATREPSALSR